MSLPVEIQECNPGACTLSALVYFKHKFTPSETRIPLFSLTENSLIFYRDFRSHLDSMSLHPSLAATGQDKLDIFLSLIDFYFLMVNYLVQQVPPYINIFPVETGYGKILIFFFFPPFLIIVFEACLWIT